MRKISWDIKGFDMSYEDFKNLCREVGELEELADLPFIVKKIRLAKNLRNQNFLFDAKCFIGPYTENEGETR